MRITGEGKKGSTQIIARFISYRTRNLVYQSKRKLKNHPDKIFITENLTQYRSNLIKHLSEMKKAERIWAYWTLDGRIFAKVSESGPKELIKTHRDIDNLPVFYADDVPEGEMDAENEDEAA